MASAVGKIGKTTAVNYVVPQPRWRITQEFGDSIELSEEQALIFVNAFLRQHLLGEVFEDWTSVGKAYVYRRREDKR